MLRMEPDIKLIYVDISLLRYGSVKCNVMSDALNFQSVKPS